MALDYIYIPNNYILKFSLIKQSFNVHRKIKPLIRNLIDYFFDNISVDFRNCILNAGQSHPM